MTHGQRIPTRLRRLGAILEGAVTSASSGSSEADPADIHLHSIPADRIRQITVELERRSDESLDEMDVLTMRLLLNEYRAAMAHLRSVTLLTDQRLANAAGPIRDAGRFLRRL